MNWVPVTEEEARLHPLFGFGGWLLAVYGVEAVLLAVSLYQVIDIALGYGLDTVAGPGFAVVWLQLALNLPFLVMAPVRARAMPLTAIVCFWAGMLSGLGSFVLMPAPLMGDLRVVSPMLLSLAWGVVFTLYLLRSRRVNVTYRLRVREEDAAFAAAPPVEGAV